MTSLLLCYLARCFPVRYWKDQLVIRPLYMLYARARVNLGKKEKHIFKHSVFPFPSRQTINMTSPPPSQWPVFDTRFRFPSTIIVAGATGSGKTTLCAKLLALKEEIFENDRCENVVVYYKEWQSAYDMLKERNIVQQWFNFCPTADDVREMAEPFRTGQGTICIIDDFMTQINKDMIEIFSVVSHHSGVTVFFLTQSIFPRNYLFRDLSINAHYIIVHKNPRENAQINYLARQINPRHAKHIVNVYHDVTNGEAFSYILLDLHQKTDEKIRVRSHITPDTFPMRVYLHK